MVRTTLSVLFLSGGLLLSQDAPPAGTPAAANPTLPPVPQPPPIAVVNLDLPPLAPPDLNSPYASPRDAARHRFQATIAQLQTSRNIGSAVQGFAEAFALDRSYAAAAYNLGILAAIAEKWTDALAALEEAARLDPAGLGKAARPSIERLRKICALEATPEGKLARRYDEALYPVLENLPKLAAADAMQSIAEVGRIDPKRWEAPALLASLTGNGHSYDVAAQFLEIAAKNAVDPPIRARLEKALEAARRELRYNSARADADAAADRGEYEKAGSLYENAWAAMPARSSNGMEAAAAWLLHDDTVHASALLTRLRDSGDADLSPLANAMLTQLEPIEPAAKASASDAREFFRDPGSVQPVVLAALVPQVDTSNMELLARPLPKLVPDTEPVVLLAALSANPAEAVAAALPELAAPKISAENPWRDLGQLAAVRPADPATTAAAVPADRPMQTGDISQGARVHRGIQVTSQPAGARITVDEGQQPVCETPCTIQAAAGTYLLHLSLAAYRAEMREVKVATKAVEVEVPLALIRGNVVLQAPPAATLKVNGAAVPNPAPVELSLIPGLYRLSAEVGGAVRERTVNVKPDARLQVEWKF
jgi:hypothetical protein